jgi:hypothetical protein
MDAHGWARWLAKKRDRRVKYIISNRQIWTPGSGWRRYTGSNPHTLHAHVSVNRAYENDTSPWFDGWLYNIGKNTIVVPAPTPPAPAPPSLLPARKYVKYGERSRAVEILQWELAVASGARFNGEEGLFSLRTAQAIINLGKILGKQWDGTYAGPDQWTAVDFIYMTKGHRPVTS